MTIAKETRKAQTAAMGIVSHDIAAGSNGASHRSYSRNTIGCIRYTPPLAAATVFKAEDAPRKASARSAYFLLIHKKNPMAATTVPGA